VVTKTGSGTTWTCAPDPCAPNIVTCSCAMSLCPVGTTSGPAQKACYSDAQRVYCNCPTCP
jgi:hypothetical protein